MQETPMLFFKGEQNMWDWTPAADLSAGCVVPLGANLVGVNAEPIAAHRLGAVSIEGKYKARKKSNATTFAVGVEVGWDDDAGDDGKGAAVASGDGSSNRKIGVVVSNGNETTPGSANGDEYVLVQLNQKIS